MGNLVSVLGLSDAGSRVFQYLEADNEEDAARELRSRKAVDYRRSDGQTFLHQAALRDQVDFIRDFHQTVEELSADRKDRPLSKKRKKKSLLSGHGRLATSTYQWKKLVNAYNNKGQTPLMLACSKGNHKVVQLLLRLGADPVMRDSVNERTALHYAAGAAGSLSCVEALLGDDVTCLTDQGRRKLRDCWIDRGIEGSQHRGCRYIDCPDKNNVTPLHLAAAAGNVRVCKLLLRAGCRIDVVAEKVCVHGPSSSRSGNRRSGCSRMYSLCTPLHISAARGDYRIARAMLRAYVMSAQAVTGMDVRRKNDGAGNQPHQVEMMRFDARLASLLDPSVPLALALASETAVHRDMPWGPLSLKVLSAATLQMDLLQQLDLLQPPQTECIALVAEASMCCSTAGAWGQVRDLLRSPTRAGKEMGHPHLSSDTQECSEAEEDPCCCQSPSSPSCRSEGKRDCGTSHEDEVNCSWGEIECSGEDRELAPCSICFDSPPGIAIDACGHRLCAACARQLCVLTGFGRAPQCPFCRVEIGHFT